jgi:hypothetical protein
MEWIKASEAERSNLLEHFLESAFQSRAIDDAQRTLVEYIFSTGSPNRLTHEILDRLLNSNSAFKLRHLRREFIDRATQIFPLHPEVLKIRAGYDYRALLLWDSFYGDEIDARAEPYSLSIRRKYELWGLTESSNPPEIFSKFAPYIETVHRIKVEKQNFDFLDDARRILSRLSKHFGIRKDFHIQITKDLGVPFRLIVSQPAVQMDEAFFKELDEELWSAICVGAFQVFYDFDSGLYEPRRLMERFFQASFLAGTPIAKVIRLCVWLAVSENMITPQILKSNPEKIVETLPFMNSLLIFYLSPDFDIKTRSCGLLPT